MLMWTRNVQEIFNVFFSSFDVISVLSFYQKLNHTVYFWSSFHLCLPSALPLSRGNKSWYHVTNGAGLQSYLPTHLTFRLTKQIKPFPLQGWMAQAFDNPPELQELERMVREGEEVVYICAKRQFHSLSCSWQGAPPCKNSGCASQHSVSRG